MNRKFVFYVPSNFLDSKSRYSKLMIYTSYSMEGAWHWFNHEPRFSHHQNVLLHEI